MEPPFMFDPCKGTGPEGKDVNLKLVKDCWSSWYRNYVPGNKGLGVFRKASTF
jgi:hypothetical protein